MCLTQIQSAVFTQPQLCLAWQCVQQIRRSVCHALVKTTSSEKRLVEFILNMFI